MTGQVWVQREVKSTKVSLASRVRGVKPSFTMNKGMASEQLEIAQVKAKTQWKPKE